METPHMLRLMEEYIEKNPQVRQVTGRTAPEPRDAARWEESVNDDEIKQYQYKKRDEADESTGSAIGGNMTRPWS